MTSLIPFIWRTSETEMTHQDTSYFFEKVIEKNNSKFQQIGVSDATQDNISKMIHTELRGQEEKLTNASGDVDVTSKLVSIFQDWDKNTVIPAQYGAYVTLDEPLGIILRTANNAILIISKDLEQCKKIYETMRLDFEKLNKTTKDFGLNLSEVLTGNEYSMSMINRNNENIKQMNLRPTKNTFEEEVIGELGKITNCNLNNVEIQFSEPTETFEYDILLPTAREHVFDIEVTDYESAKGKVHENLDSLKSQLILSTLDKAQRLSATSIIITKGFPEETFNQMKEVANSRHVTLLNENNYKETLPKIILTKLLNRFEDYSNRYSRLGRTRNPIARKARKPVSSYIDR